MGFLKTKGLLACSSRIVFLGTGIMILIGIVFTSSYNEMYKYQYRVLRNMQQNPELFQNPVARDLLDLNKLEFDHLKLKDDKRSEKEYVKTNDISKRSHEDTPRTEDEKKLEQFDKEPVKEDPAFVNTDEERESESNEASAISRYRTNFLLWDLVNPPPMNDIATRESDEYFMYECPGFCGGWADQLKGTMFAYIVANLTGRRFKARYLKGFKQCGTLNYIVPNRVNWSLPEDWEPKNKSDMKFLNNLGDGGMKDRIKQVNFSEKWVLDKKYYTFLANLEYLSGLAESKVYTHEVAWMRDITPADVYGAIYKRLFKLAPPLQRKLEQVLYEALPHPKNKLVCIHVRLGHEAFGSDWAKRNSVNNLPKIWKFMETLLKDEYHKLFVMSDSWSVMDSAREQDFKDRLVTIPGAIVHVNKFSWKNMTVVCDGIEKLMLEHHMLMNCDVLVRGHSGLSVIASAVRGTDKDLYCLHGDGNIVPCERNNFTTFI